MSDLANICIAGEQQGQNCVNITCKAILTDCVIFTLDRLRVRIWKMRDLTVQKYSIYYSYERLFTPCFE